MQSSEPPDVDLAILNILEVKELKKLKEERKETGTAKYLARYAAREAGLVSGLIKSISQQSGSVADLKPQCAAQNTQDLSAIWQQCLVIPAYSELFELLEGVTLSLRSSLAGVLQIWVINCPDNAGSESVEVTNECLQDALKNSIGLAHCENIFLRQFSWGTALIVDRVSVGLEIPHKKGVGYARKIGADVALQLHELGLVNSDWCCFTDADAILPADYFKRLNRDCSGIAALVFPHTHKPEGGMSEKLAIRYYQFKLNHHVAGLLNAGSPYAFHSIGSTICCDFESYKKVRGIPARAAGEDFYFLNKLAKVGKVKSLAGSPVILSGRPSLRVPFGTGPAMVKASQADSPPIRHYHPLIYKLLAILIKVGVPALWQSRDDPNPVFEQISRQFIGVLNLLDSSDRRHLVTQCFIDSGMRVMVPTLLARSRTREGFYRQFHCWFDGFRTLKFIHWWRDQGLHDVQVEETTIKGEEANTEVSLRRDG